MKNQVESFEPKPIDIGEQEVIRKVVPFRFEKANKNKIVDIKIIECPHETSEDTDFILKSLENISPERALFVEQGSPKQKDHLVSQLKEIASKYADIREDFLQRKECMWTILEGLEDSPFARASDYIASCDGKVVNMDLSSRIDQDAINFITQESSPEFALERAYVEVQDACFDYQKTIPKILKLLFPRISEHKVEYACQKLYKTYHRSDSALERSKKINDYWYFLREKFMRQILEDQVDDSDYVLCHPEHAEKIKTPRNKIIIPEKPENLFEFK